MSTPSLVYVGHAVHHLHMEEKRKELTGEERGVVTDDLGGGGGEEDTGEVEAPANGGSLGDGGD